MSIKRRVLMYSKSRVPAGYKEVKYLESNGGAGAVADNITTGWEDTYHCKMIAAYTDETGTNGVGCVRTYSGGKLFGISMSSNKCTVFNSGLSTSMIIDIALDSGFHEIESDNNGNVFIDGVYKGNMQLKSVDDAVYIGLLAYAYNGAKVYASYTGKVKYFSVSNDGVEMANFIPCIRLSDNKPFFYNQYKDEFYGNKVTGCEFGYETFDGTYVAPTGGGN